MQLGGNAADSPGYDLIGLLVGSEGTLGIVTRIWVRLVPINETVKTILAVFPNMEDASSAVAGMIARRIVPAAIEMMDNLTIRAIESRMPSGYPVEADAVVLIEVDGLREEVEAQSAAVQQVCADTHALSVRIARTTPNGQHSGQVAKARLRRSDVSRRTTTRSTASSRGPNCPPP